MKSLIAGIILVLSSTSIVSKPANSSVHKEPINITATIAKIDMVVDPATVYQQDNKNKIICNSPKCWELIIKDHNR